MALFSTRASHCTISERSYHGKWTLPAHIIQDVLFVVLIDGRAYTVYRK